MIIINKIKDKFDGVVDVFVIGISVVISVVYDGKVDVRYV